MNLNLGQISRAVIAGAILFALIPAALLAVTRVLFFEPMPITTGGDWFHFAAVLAGLGAVFGPLLLWAHGARASFTRTFVRLLPALTAFGAVIMASRLVTDPLLRWVAVLLVSNVVLAALGAFVDRILPRILGATDAA